jgi:hypothetical protein
MKSPRSAIEIFFMHNSIIYNHKIRRAKLKFTKAKEKTKIKIKIKSKKEKKRKEQKK